MSRLRIGILGAAKIAPAALIRPARALPDVDVVSVAARDPERARHYADKHGIARVHPTYEALVEDPDVDAIYNPLPNGLHGRWTLAAIAAGKHVLCEKPLTANADEAAIVARAGDESGLTVMEAFHYRHHPLAARMREVVEQGLIGEVRHIEAWMCFPLPNRRDIRYRLDLAGGATMDAGCYAINMIRLMAASEPEVVSARAKLSTPGVDRAMVADLSFADGRTARMHTSMLSSSVLRIGVRATGDGGELRVLNPVAPQHYHRLVVRTPAGKRIEHLSGPSTYQYQLEHFAEAVLTGGPVITTTADAVANMTVIDAVYAAAGLPVREPTT
ncbi:MAG TPA: Gfo/Idh/MocA family oxidoreductase [Acidimicrobiales bacterium]